LTRLLPVGFSTRGGYKFIETAANHLPRQASENEPFDDEEIAFMRLKAKEKNKVRRNSASNELA